MCVIFVSKAGGPEDQLRFLISGRQLKEVQGAQADLQAGYKPGFYHAAFFDHLLHIVFIVSIIFRIGRHQQISQWVKLKVWRCREGHSVEP